MPICIHCDFYNSIPDRLRKTVKIPGSERVIHKRYCKHVERDVDPEDQECLQFEPHPYFLCEKFRYRLHIILCLNRQKAGVAECKKCLQAEDVLDVGRGRDLYKHFGVDRRLHKPNIKKKANPTLRRRRDNASQDRGT